MAKRIDNGDALLQKAWETKLDMESQEGDVRTGFSGTFSGNAEYKGTPPDEAVMKVTLPPGVNEKTIGLLLDLTGGGVEGAGKALVNNTEDMDLRHITVYANDFRHGVNTEQYGLHAHRLAGYKILEKVNPLLARWRNFRRGRYMREAELEKYSSNLTEAPTSRTKHWNRHILFKNVGWSAQPSYDSTLATYTGNLVTAATTAGVGAASQLDNQAFTDIEHFICNEFKIEPFADGTYIFYVASRQAVYLKRLNNTNESFANYTKDAHVEKYVNAAYGNYLTKFGKFHIIEDNRNAVIDHTVATGALTAYYRDVGSTDNRTSAAGNEYDVNVVSGRNSLIEAIAMPVRYDDDISDFNRLKSIGISESCGFQSKEYDDDTETDTSRIGQNSAIVLAGSGSATV